MILCTWKTLVCIAILSSSCYYYCCTLWLSELLRVSGVLLLHTVAVRAVTSVRCITAAHCGCHSCYEVTDRRRVATCWKTTTLRCVNTCLMTARNCVESRNRIDEFYRFCCRFLCDFTNRVIIFTARRNSWKLFQRCICHDAVCPSVLRHIPAFCRDEWSYDHAVFTDR